MNTFLISREVMMLEWFRLCEVLASVSPRWMLTLRGLHYDFEWCVRHGRYKIRVLRRSTSGGRRYRVTVSYSYENIVNIAPRDLNGLLMALIVIWEHLEACRIYDLNTGGLDLKLPQLV
jgi:hypothetical protein